MKYFNKLMVFFLFILFSYGVDIFAYKYKITNQTDRDVKVRLHYAFGTLNNRPTLIKTGNHRVFNFGGWEAGLCLNKITVSTQDSAGKWGKPKKAKMRLITDKGVEITRSIHPVILVPGPPIMSVCKSEKFFLRINPKSKKISAIVFRN